MLKESVATAMEDDGQVYVAFFDKGLFFQLWEISIRHGGCCIDVIYIFGVAPGYRDMPRVVPTRMGY